MTDSELFSYVDHTNLKPQATPKDIEKLCAEALQYKTASVCVNPCYVSFCKKLLAESNVKVCTVIGFPLGACDTATKAFETKNAIANGADECDMVINIGALKAGDIQTVYNDILAVRSACAGKVLKVIIETCLLTDIEKETMCELVVKAGADYIKTSTGFSLGGATFKDVSLLAKCIAKRCKIKAAGGIRTRQDMEQFLLLGADRLGTSSAVNILTSV